MNIQPNEILFFSSPVVASVHSCRVAISLYLNLRRHDIYSLLAIDNSRAAVCTRENAETTADGADLGYD